MQEREEKQSTMQQHERLSPVASSRILSLKAILHTRSFVRPSCSPQEQDPLTPFQLNCVCTYGLCLMICVFFMMSVCNIYLTTTRLKILLMSHKAIHKFPTHDVSCITYNSLNQNHIKQMNWSLNNAKNVTLKCPSILSQKK